MKNNKYKSLIVSYKDGKHESTCIVNKFRELEAGEVLVRTKYSSLNYKDALSVTGTSKIIRKNNLTPGLDFSGIVEETSSKKFSIGEKVFASGSGLGELVDGGFSEYIYIKSDKLLKMPKNLNLLSTMQLGTAGFTAAIAIEKMILNKQNKILGPILISGAAGGVGSISLSILKSLGYETIALTRKKSSTSYLKSIGADHVMYTNIISNSKFLNKKVIGGAIDNIGGDTLDWIIKSTNDGGNVVSVGMASNSELNTTVFPFIMRGVNVLGVSSTNYTGDRRKIWRKLSTKYKPKNLKKINTKIIDMKNIINLSKKIVSGKNKGRVIIKFS